MEYRRYPTYKDSGIEWLGEVPEHWDETVVSVLFDDNKRKNKGSVEQNLLSLSYGRIVNKDINTEEGLLPASFDTYQIVEPDYIVLRLTDLQNDQRSLRVGHVRERGIITSAYTVLKKKSFRMSSARYFYYLLHVYDLMKVFYGMGAGVRQSLGFDEFKKIRLLLPDEDEQESIVQFLDHETGRIDALIEKKQRLIELLKEKRQAVITQAVTKGLDPNVPMKDSGVEWLEEVPEHWQVGKVKNLATQISKGTTPTTVGGKFVDEGTRFLKAENIFDGQVLSIPEFFIDEETHAILSRSALRAGDVLVVIAGATTGKAVVLGSEFLPANTNQAVSFVRLLDKRMANFVSLWMSTIFVQNHIWLNAVQAAQPNLSMEDLGNLPMVIPPVEEALAIVEDLKIQVGRLSDIIEKTNHSVVLLQEHRSALITAAVTGQIDVRDAA